MNILAIDTSSPHGSVALLVDGALIFEEEFTADRTTSASLFAVLTRAREHAPQVDQIAVGLGPGSYAGIRIAIAGAMGIGIVHGARLVGLPSVAALQVEASHY